MNIKLLKNSLNKFGLEVKEFFCNPAKNENFYLIIYKLLHDALALGFLTFIAMMVVEGLLPGLITAHVSLTKVILVLFALIAAISWLGKKMQITYDTPRIKKNKSLPIMILFTFLLIGNSLLKFALWENLTITVVTIIIFYLLYKLMFSDQAIQ